MIAVSDAGPLRYLSVLQHTELLAHSFDKVLVPASVCRDLSHAKTPPEVRSLITSPPAWLETAVVREAVVESKSLGRGEREAITLAIERGHILLLCDDAEARAVAERNELRVVGTLGILKQAALDSRIDLSATLEMLKTSTNFRGTDELYQRVLRDFENERKH